MVVKSNLNLPRMSLKVRSNASNENLLIIGASSQIMTFALLISSDNREFLLILQVDVSCTLSGILNLEWAVLPFAKSKAA